MKRRTLLKVAAAGASAMAASVARNAMAADAPPVPAEVGPFELADATVAELSAAMHGGALVVDVWRVVYNLILRRMALSFFVVSPYSRTKRKLGRTTSSGFSSSRWPPEQSDGQMHFSQ
jgi:hypothetical protein